MARASLYRKYRSQSFGDLVGQRHVIRTLQNGIESGRIAHAFLFTGPRGTGKTSTARLMAKALCCRQGPAVEPCNECDICLSITEGTCLDVHEMDAASESGVDDVRESIIEAVSYKPSTARYRIFIIDEVHDLSSKAFDALLKTIEEPPDHVIFMLATTEYTKVPTTIRSRCQKFEFHRASMADLIARIVYVAKEESVEIEPAAAAAIARMADGGFRDALTLLEQSIIAADGAISAEQVYDQLGLIADQASDALLIAIKDADIPTIISLVGELARLGRDPRSIIESLLFRTAELSRAAYNVDLQGVDAAQAAALHEAAQRIGVDNLLWLRGALAETHQELRQVTLPRLWFEAQLIRLAQRGAGPAPAAKAAPVKAVVETRGKPHSEPAPPSSDQPKEIRPEPATPKVEPKPEMPEAKREAPMRESTGDELMDKALQVWDRLMLDLPPTLAHARKLDGSRVLRVTGNHMIIEVRKNMDAAWWAEKPERAGYLGKVLAAAQITGWTFEFVAPTSKKPEQEPAAVELELSGKALYEAAKEVSQS